MTQSADETQPTDRMAPTGEFPTEPRTRSSLRADPDGPRPTDWREPPWFPPRDRDRGRRDDGGPQLVRVVIGLVLVLIGVYYFLDRTLGIPMPSIAWGSLWPVLLILLGGLILFRSVERRR